MVCLESSFRLAAFCKNACGLASALVAGGACRVLDFYTAGLVVVIRVLSIKIISFMTSLIEKFRRHYCLEINRITFFTITLRNPPGV